MKHVAAATRITIGLACLATLLLIVAQATGLVQNGDQAVIQSRLAVCDAVAVHLSLLAEENQVAKMEAALRAVEARNNDVFGATLRGGDQQVIAQIGQVEANAQSANDPSVIAIPIFSRGARWGTVDLQFNPHTLEGVPFWQRRSVHLVLLTAVVSFALFFLYVRGMLQYYDPSQVVPDRVRSALDTLAEGVLVVDNQERIVLVNEALSHTLGQSPKKLIGAYASELPWTLEDAESHPSGLPWRQALCHGRRQTGTVLGLDLGAGGRYFRVNSSPIFGEDGLQRGAIASFDDVTAMELNRAELRDMLQVLEESRDEISRQNEELQVLATQDPLTLCTNRRAFFTQFETDWNNAVAGGEVVSCIMVDIDNFKLINDTHGHAVGDLVLKRIAELLRAGRRDIDLVCRLGGEEFCILLPWADGGYARHVAETLRRAIAATPIVDLAVTASLGVATSSDGAADPHDLLNQADKALYLAKRKGRNQVVSWDEVPLEFALDAESAPRIRAAAETPAESPIPFHAVTALVSALSFRDATTAEHCRRVADLCVAAANGVLSVGDTYTLEIAALLHDIGKVGVPDAVLLKPGPLTPDEWKMMDVHDRIGVEIIRTTFNSSQLLQIVQYHRAWYNGSTKHVDAAGKDLPHGARILAIADAFDAMVTDRVYRRGRAQEDAFAELRRCAGKQFDPDVVEHFIEMVRARDESRAAQVGSVSKQTALRIGMEIERLAAALDDQDLFGLTVLAGRLKETASMEGIEAIAEAAALLETAAGDEPDLREVIQLTTELLQLCRATQRVYLQPPAASR